MATHSNYRQSVRVLGRTEQSIASNLLDDFMNKLMLAMVTEEVPEETLEHVVITIGGGRVVHEHKGWYCTASTRQGSVTYPEQKTKREALLDFLLKHEI